MRKILSPLLSAFLLTALAFQTGCAPADMDFDLDGAETPSASRGPAETWEEAVRRNFGNKKKLLALRGTPSNSSALRSALPYKQDFDIAALPEWTGNEEELKKAFEIMRDERIYKDTRNPDFPRRSTWLYARDGCFARAAHTASSFGRQNYERPGKIFAFGSLKYKTNYEPSGSVYWWFHVAAAYRVGERAVILDPGVNPDGPIFLEQWLDRFNANRKRLKLAVCDTYAYVPQSRCIGGKAGQEASIKRHHQRFLPREWNQLKRLRFDPDKLLGEEPPWKQALIAMGIEPLSTEASANAESFDDEQVSAVDNAAEAFAGALP